MFSFSGPAYLAFYLILSSVVLCLLHQLRVKSESGDAPKLNLQDPYLIAYLRGGANETLRVAMINLIDHGLLQVENTSLRTSHLQAIDAAKTPLEKGIIKAFATPAEAASIFKNKNLIADCDRTYQAYLEKLELLPNSEINKQRTKYFGNALAALFVFGVGKILFALATGHSNVLFLIGLTAVASFIAYRVTFPRLTAKGKAVLEDLRQLYGAARSHQYTPATEAMMLAAVFGMTALPIDNYGYTKQLFPQAYNSSSSGSCGSSCGSSCSSGGDGGSGCGGGCGGCGGD